MSLPQRVEVYTGALLDAIPTGTIAMTNKTADKFTTAAVMRGPSSEEVRPNAGRTRF
jgi:hypothetical protein